MGIEIENKKWNWGKNRSKNRCGHMRIGKRNGNMERMGIGEMNMKMGLRLKKTKEATRGVVNRRWKWGIGNGKRNYIGNINETGMKHFRNVFKSII